MSQTRITAEQLRETVARQRDERMRRTLREGIARMAPATEKRVTRREFEAGVES